MWSQDSHLLDVLVDNTTFSKFIPCFV